MDDNTKHKKTASGNWFTLLQGVKSWFHALSTGQKSMVIFAGIGLLLTMYIISVLIRYSDSSTISLGDNTNIQGKVIDQNGEPIDGAVITAQENSTVTNPDGTFTLKAGTSDTLTVSAYGYESTHASASESSITLSSLTPGSVRIAVVGPANQELNHALVYQLNANTLEPVAISLTDNSGEAEFNSIPSGQAAFVVLHPDYGFGWLQTSLDPGGTIRSVVRLEEISVEKKTANNFFPVVYAQVNLDGDGEQMSFKVSDITNVGNGNYQINVIGESRTFFILSYGRKELENYIDRVSQVSGSDQFQLQDNVARTINELVGRESPAIKSVRITQGPSDTNYVIEYGALSDAVVKTVKKTYEVEIEKPPNADVMGYIQQQHATTVENDDVVTVTTWSQAQAKDLADVQQMALDKPNAAVCCDQATAQASSDAAKIPSEISSHDVPLSNLTLTRPGSKTEYLNYSHRAVNEMTGGPNLQNVASAILEQNPTLSFEDKTSGSSFSFLEIPPPNPNDAPPAFLLDFFDSPSDARSTYLDTPTYQMKWRQFMASIGSEVFQKEGRTPYQVYWDLKKDIGSSQDWRETEEKRLAQQSGTQSTGQQNTNQQSAPDTMEDSGQQAGQTDSSDSQVENPQDEITESPDEELDSEQDDQQQGENPSSQGSGTGTNNSNQDGANYGPQGVQPR